MLFNAWVTTINAWIQVSHFSIEEAKENYIEIVHSILKK